MPQHQLMLNPHMVIITLEIFLCFVSFPTILKVIISYNSNNILSNFYLAPAPAYAPKAY